MRYITDEDDIYSRQLEWIENGDEHTLLCEAERLKAVLDGMLGYQERKPVLIFDLKPQHDHRLRFEIQEGPTTFEVFWQIGGGFTLFELIDSSLDDTPWNAAGAEI